MRHLIVIGIIFLIISSAPLAGAGEVFMWTDDEGVVHITDNPRAVPPVDETQRIRYRERDGSNDRSVPDAGPPEEAFSERNGKGEAVGARGEESSGEMRRAQRQREIERARAEYDRVKNLVERRRRDYSRNRTRHNRDQYRHALDVLAQKRERIRELERQR